MHFTFQKMLKSKYLFHLPENQSQVLGREKLAHKRKRLYSAVEGQVQWQVCGLVSWLSEYRQGRLTFKNGAKASTVILGASLLPLGLHFVNLLKRVVLFSS